MGVVSLDLILLAPVLLDNVVTCSIDGRFGAIGEWKGGVDQRQWWIQNI